MVRRLYEGVEQGDVLRVKGTNPILVRSRTNDNVRGLVRFGEYVFGLDINHSGTRISEAYKKDDGSHSRYDSILQEAGL
jgi:hypothetical protein